MHDRGVRGGHPKPKEVTMCDYSLEMYQSRPAQVGEEYRSYRFSSGSVGFIAPGDSSVAICMACDSQLQLENISEHVQKSYGLGKSEVVSFTRKEQGPHHDAVKFSNGTVLTLQQLGPSVHAHVISALTDDGGTVLEETHQVLEDA